MTLRSFEIGGMHCDACAERIRAQVEALEGVSSAKVDFEDALLRIDAPEDLGRDALADAVGAAGEYSLGPEVHRSGDPAEPEPGDASGRHARGSVQPAPGVAAATASSYGPLAILVGYMLLFALAPWIASAEFSLSQAMGRFMAAFFFAFSFFKMLDLPGFARMYQQYDLISRRAQAWSWAYPFVELALGFFFLTGLWPIPVYVVTLGVMGVSGLGVLRTMQRGETIRCACLGTIIPLPLGLVTLIEDFGMAAMALVMLILHLV